MGSVQFATTTSVPNTQRTTSVPSASGFTHLAWVKLTSYGDYTTPFAWEGSDPFKRIYYEASASGDFYIWRDDDVSWYAIPLLSGSDTDWHCVAIVSDGTDLAVYLAGDGASSFTLIESEPFAPSPGAYLSYGRQDAFPNDGNGTFRIAGSKIWAAALSESELNAELTSLTPIRTANLSFANNCQDAATVYEDQSNTGGDFSLTGTPTDSSDGPVLPSSDVDSLFFGSTFL